MGQSEDSGWTEVRDVYKSMLRGHQECEAEQLVFFLLDSGRSPKMWHIDSSTSDDGEEVTWSVRDKHSRDDGTGDKGRWRTVHCETL